MSQDVETDLLFEPATGTFFRKVLSTPTRVSLMPVGVKKEWNFFLTREQYEFRLENQLLEPQVRPVVHEDDHGVIDLAEGSAKAQQHGDDLHDRLRLSEVDEEKLLTREGRASHFAALKDKGMAISKTTYYKAVRRWLEGGLNALALRARWCSRQGKLSAKDLSLIDSNSAVKAVREKSQGLQRQTKPEVSRPGSTSSGEARKRAAPFQPSLYRVDENTLRVFMTYYNRKQKTRGLTLETAYKQMRREVFSTQQPFGEPLHWPIWSIPTLSMFKFYWRELVSHVDRRISQNGPHAHKLKGRALGQSVSAAYAAGRVGELDATVWNCELIGEGEHAPIIGPPIVFRIRCKDTGQLLGISIGLENASWDGAAAAIANCLEDKTEFLTRMGLANLPLTWQVRGLPAQITADQGETYNHKPRRFIRLTGVSIETLPGGRGDLKPGVESDWNTLQTSLNQLTPGALIKAYEEEVGIKWHMKASMTLRAFTQMLLLQELAKMHLPREGIKLPEDMVRDGVSTSSRMMFDWSVRNGGGGLKQFDEKLVRLSLLPVQPATISEYGVTVRGVHFACAPLKVAQAFEKARSAGRKKVRVAYDPLLTNQVWLIQGDEHAPTSYTACQLDMRFVHQKSYVGKTWREVLNIVEAATVTNRDDKEALAQALAEISALQAKLAADGEVRRHDARAEFPTTEAALIRNREKERLAEKNELSPALAITADMQARPQSEPAQVISIVQARAASPLATSSRLARLAALQQAKQSEQA